MPWMPPREKTCGTSPPRFGRSTVSAAYGLVYGANEEGDFFALDAATGNRKWHYSLGDPLDCFVFNSPVVYEHAVYGGLVEHFVGLDALAGKPIWERKKMPAGQEELMSPPAAGNGLIFVGFDWKTGMFALSAKTGQTKWQNNKGLATYRASPSLVGQTIYSDGNDGALHVLDWQNGREEWKSPTGSGSFSSPVVAGDKVLIGTAAGKLFGLNAATGEQQWFKNYPAQATLSFVPYGIGGRPLLSSPRFPERLLTLALRRDISWRSTPTPERNYGPSISTHRSLPLPPSPAMPCISPPMTAQFMRSSPNYPTPTNGLNWPNFSHFPQLDDWHSLSETGFTQRREVARSGEISFNIFFPFPGPFPSSAPYAFA